MVSKSRRRVFIVLGFMSLGLAILFTIFIIGTTQLVNYPLDATLTFYLAAFTFFFFAFLSFGAFLKSR